MSKENQHHGNKWMPVVYVTYFPMLQEIANEYGYALAIHGSVTRDFDLIAVPWIDQPKPVLGMLQAMKDIVGITSQYKNDMPYSSMTVKPCGRIAYTIPSGSGGYFDISVTPILKI